VVNLLEKGSAWLQEQLWSHAVTEATYKRGSDSATIDVVRAETMAQLNTEYGMSVDVRIADFLIKETDLVIPPAVTATKPMRNDQIIIEVGDETVTYEVLSEGGEDLYRESDRYGNVIRVHTKELGRV